MQINKIVIVILVAWFSSPGWGQMHYGSIEYEVTVNLEKRFPQTNSNRGGQSGYRGGRGGFGATTEKYLKEKAVLYFNDTMSLFVTEELENVYSQNQTFLTITKTNFNTRAVETQINLLGEKFLIQDEISERVWKFTNKERLIAGKMAKQAITQINDTTTIYAWFDTDVFPSIGPESYRDLPGAILGLAYEDGSVTYFATKISYDYPKFEMDDFSTKSKNTYNRTNFLKEFGTKYKSSDRLYQLVKDLLHFY